MPQWTAYLEYLHQIIQYLGHVVEPRYVSDRKKWENDESESIEIKLVQQRKSIVVSSINSLSLGEAPNSFVVLVSCGVAIDTD